MKNPAEVARGYLTLGKIKTEQTAVRLLLLGMLAGAFIALAGAAATFGNVYVGKVAGAGIDQHLHMHIVPRWNGDTNFMPVIGEVRVLSESLASTYSRIKAIWPSIE